MRAVVVDPRDVTWEVEAPRYRVTFWVPSDGGWAGKEYEVSEADVAEVLAWAQERTPESATVTIGVLIDSPAGRGLVRLSGQDPTQGATAGAFSARADDAETPRCSCQRDGSGRMRRIAPTAYRAI